MAYTLSTAAQNAACDAIVDLVDTGSGTAAIQMRDSGQLIATLNLNNPAFGASSSGVATLDVVTTAVEGSVTPAGFSTIDRFTIVDRDGTAVFTGSAGSVATSGADINLSSVTVNQNDEVRITGLTVTVPASGGA